MNCKPPCMAFVKRGHHGFKHAGKVVEVLPEAWPDDGNGPEWTVVFPHPIQRLDGSIDRRAVCPDAWLEPFKDGEENESWFKSAPLERAKPAEVEA